MIERLFEAGADVFRINMSHTPQDRMRNLVAAIRDVERKRSRPIGILADLQGPKLRIGVFAGDAVMLSEGATFVLDSDPKEGTVERVHLPHPEILSAPSNLATSCCSTTARSVWSRLKLRPSARLPVLRSAANYPPARASICPIR